MNIKDLPPKIAKLALQRKEEYEKAHGGKTYQGYVSANTLSQIFEWGKTPEYSIWTSVNGGNYKDLYKNYPHLREEYIEEPQIVNNYEIF